MLSSNPRLWLMVPTWMLAVSSTVAIEPAVAVSRLDQQGLFLGSTPELTHRAWRVVVQTWSGADGLIWGQMWAVSRMGWTRDVVVDFEVQGRYAGKYPGRRSKLRSGTHGDDDDGLFSREASV